MARRPSDRGSATPELLVAVPLLLLTMLAVVQFGVALHAQQIAQAVADRALAVANAEGSSAAAGQAEAASDLSRLAGRNLLNTRAAVTRTDQESTVTITGTATEVVPFVHLRIRAHAAGPVERITQDVSGPGG
ncbi:TadE/TadG family type IV pilus assembly protein [Streptacidiphilus albus]|uniref:TadE/TadG family type IV pilus assembly protein n=1 Tax=Streptacidiphilus albus TaxID=105425 RepID=UPI00054BD30B|nr:TadE/TadG family type IV pilus assembly protein [Streptacidiphilus albus]